MHTRFSNTTILQVCFHTLCESLESKPVTWLTERKCTKIMLAHAYVRMSVRPFTYVDVVLCSAYASHVGRAELIECKTILIHFHNWPQLTSLCLNSKSEVYQKWKWISSSTVLHSNNSARQTTGLLIIQCSIACIDCWAGTCLADGVSWMQNQKTYWPDFRLR